MKTILLTILISTTSYHNANSFVTTQPNSRTVANPSNLRIPFQSVESTHARRFQASALSSNKPNININESTSTANPKKQKHHPLKSLPKSLTTILCITLLTLTPTTTTTTTTTTTPTFLQPPPANAASFTSLTPEQKSVAEAWRVIDSTFYDRTFNGQNWFQLREDAVKQKYKTPDDARAAIETITSKLGDKYTRYLSPDKYASMVNAATGTLAGVGVEISVDKTSGNVYASDVEEESPASRAGIKTGDVFMEVDGMKVVPGVTAPDAVAGLLRGPEGSRVGVVMSRNGEVKDFIPTRARITVTTVKSYLSKKDGVGKVGVIRIKSFSGTTAATVTEKLKDLKGQGATAFVIDLRRNPGGLLPGGVDTASLFLDVDRPIVYTVSKTGVIDSQKSLVTGLDIESPLVLFVDGNTASAAEVMTAALKENKRAVVVGEQTFGKGVVQTIRELSNNNGGVAVTVARYETPDRNDINKQGIKVDIPVSDCVSDNAVTCIPQTAFNKPST